MQYFCQIKFKNIVIMDEVKSSRQQTVTLLVMAGVFISFSFCNLFINVRDRYQFVCLIPLAIVPFGVMYFLSFMSKQHYLRNTS